MGEQSTLLRVELAYPSREKLSQNGRANPYARDAGKAQAKAEAEMLARSAYNLLVKQGRPYLPPPEGEIPIRYTFYPPPRGKRWDDDNAIGAMKAARDGIARALRIDDKRFKTAGVAWGPNQRIGIVVVEVGHAE